MKFYIDGEWVEPNTLKKLDVINPADESIAGTIALGNEEDVDKAVRAARKAFTTFSYKPMTEYRCLKKSMKFIKIDTVRWWKLFLKKWALLPGYVKVAQAAMF